MPSPRALSLVLVLAAGLAMASAQDPVGSLSGKLTDLYSKPLPGTAITLRNLRSGTIAHATTGRNGAYQFTALAPGEYVLEAESPQSGYGRLGGIMISPGHEAHVQAAIAFGRLPPPPRNRLAAGAPSSRIEPSPASSSSSSMAISAQPIASAPRAGNNNSLPPEAPSNPGVAQIADTALAARPSREPAIPEDRAATRRSAQIPAPTPPPHAAVLAGNPPETAISLARSPEAGLQPSLQSAMRPTPSVAATIVTASLATDLLRRQTGFALAAICGLQAQLHAEWPRRRAVELAESATTIPDKLSGEQLQQLPLAGRHWEEFVLDSPETSGQGAAGNEEEPSHTGQPGRDPLVVDGAHVQLAFGGRQTGPRASSLVSPAAGETAIHEVDTSFHGADLAPGQPSVDSQKGSPILHGQASVFDRQNLWGARNPFTAWIQTAPPSTPAGFPGVTSLPYTAPDRDLTWGAGIGGRIPRQRSFWFLSANGSDRNDPGVATVKHPENFFAQPSNDEMQVLSARLGLSNANPVAEGRAAYAGELAQIAGVLGPAPRSATQRAAFARFDSESSERHRFTLEGAGALLDSPGGGLTRASETYGSHSFGNTRTSEFWLLGRWDAFLTPNLLAVTQASTGRHIYADLPQSPSTLEQSLLGSAWGQLPQMVVDSRYGFTMGNPARFGPGANPDERMMEAQETLDWVHRTLLFKTGFDLRHNSDATGFVRNHLGTFVYSSVENFVSDALVFSKYGLTDALDPMHQHNCDPRGRAWRDGSGQLLGLGYLPCYSYYTQTMGPTDWYLSTNDWAGFATAQWQPAKRLVLAAGMRWEHEQLPPPIAKLANSELPLAGKLPSLGNQWGPRLSLAWGSGESRLPVIRAGYGMYFGRTQNSVLETLLTRTGSPDGDLNFFFRPVDNLAAGGAPPFPYVLTGEPSTIVKPDVVQMAPGFRNPEVHQGEVAVEEKLPGKVEVTATALVSLGRHLPVTADTNLDPAVNPGTITYAVIDPTGEGPLHGHVTVPFFASWPASQTGGRLHPGFQQIVALASRANSTYEAAMLRITRSSRRGLTLNARYTYAHAMDWNPNETTQIAATSMLDPNNFALEYGTSNLDVRHSGSASLIWQAPWKAKHWEGGLVNGWMLSGVGHFRSGLPYTMRTAGSITEEFMSSGTVIAGLGPGMNGLGGDDRVYGVGRNTYRYPLTWKADLRLGKTIDLGHLREVQLFAESFNLFNHQNVTLLETTGYSIVAGSTSGTMPTLNFLTGLKTGQTEFGKPLDVNATDFFRPRQIDFGMRMRF